MEILINKKPLISTYADTAYFLSILKEENNWLYTYFTQIFFDISEINFLTYTYGNCLLIDYFEYYWEKETINHSIVDFLISMIDMGYCAIIELNQKFISNRRGYQKYDFQHSNMVFGYDEKYRFFKLMGIDDYRVFSESEISYDDFILAFKTIDDYELPIRFAKRKEGAIYEVDWNKIYYDLNAYINNGIEENNYGKCLFGQDVIRKFKKMLYNMLIGSARKDSRQISIINDHKVAMLNKMKYFPKIGVPINDDIIKDFEEIKLLSFLCMRLFLKFELNSDEKTYIKIINLLDEIVEKEKPLYIATASIIENYIKKINWQKQIGFNGD